VSWLDPGVERSLQLQMSCFFPATTMKEEAPPPPLPFRRLLPHSSAFGMPPLMMVNRRKLSTNRALFSFASLMSPEDNLFSFARGHAALRLQRELSRLAEETSSTGKRRRARRREDGVVRAKVRAKPLTGESAPYHTLPLPPKDELGGEELLRVGEDVPGDRARKVRRTLKPINVE